MSIKVLNPLSPPLKKGEVKVVEWRSGKFIISLLLLAFIVIFNNAAAGAVSAQLNRSTITLGETATLVIDLSAVGNARPDLSPLKKDFDIVNTGTSTQVQIINGHRTDSRQLNITLQPRNAGQFKIPAITVGKAQTSPLQLLVKDIPTVSQSEYGKVLWLEIDSPMKADNREVMVQQEVPVTVKLFTSLPLNNVSISEPAANNTIVEKLGDDIQYNVQRNGKQYQVVEQHYVLFPEQPGDLTIAPVVLRANTPERGRRQNSFGGSAFGDPFNDPFFKNAFGGNSQIQQMLSRSNMLFGQRGKAVTLRSNGLKFSVQHIPEAAKGKPWLPARNVSLSSSWQDHPPSLVTGEPAVLTITVKAEGLIGTQIPALNIDSESGIYSIYAEPAEMQSLTDGEHAIGISKQTFTIIPEKAGTITLPEIKQAWWNTRTNKLQWEKIPQLTLRVKQGVGNPVQNNSKPDNKPLSGTTDLGTGKSAASELSTADTVYSKAYIMQLIADNKWLLAGILLLIIIVTAVLYRNKAVTKHRVSGRAVNTAVLAGANEQQSIDRQQLKLFLQDAINACESGNSQQAASALLQWSKLAWPDLAPVSLLDIADNINQGAENIRQLHQSLYQSATASSEWRDTELAELLRQGLQRKKTKQVTTDKAILPPLYPA